MIGFWDSEWTGIAPMLEEDVATSSIAQDEIGHARALYELLAELTDDDPDRIAYGREPAEYRHAALLDHPRGDWAFTVARRYLYETADAVRLAALARLDHEPLALLVGKMRREETYHLLHADAWLRRLAGAARKPRDRLVAALRAIWADASRSSLRWRRRNELFAAASCRGRWRRSTANGRRDVRPVLEPCAGQLAGGRRRVRRADPAHGRLRSGFTASSRASPAPRQGAMW